MNPFWSSFSGQVGRSGRNAAVFIVAVLFLFGAFIAWPLMLYLISRLADIDPGVKRALLVGAASVFLFLLYRGARRRRLKEGGRYAPSPLSYEELRRAKIKLKKP